MQRLCPILCARIGTQNLQLCSRLFMFYTGVYIMIPSTRRNARQNVTSWWQNKREK
jgi:hypothetical protein